MATASPKGSYAKSALGSNPTDGKIAASINAVTSIRDMHCITISESELHTLSACNGLTTLFIGLSTTFLGLAIGIYTSFLSFDQANMTPESKAFCKLGIPSFGLLTIIFAIAAIISFKFSWNQLKQIRNEMRKTS